MIGDGVYLLLTQPGQFSKLQAEPEHLHNVIEETPCYEPPITSIARITLEDFDLHGNTIRAGQIVRSSLASANRDAAHLPDPEHFGISRKPGRDFSFGPHGCLGASLVREEACKALETLFRRMPASNQTRAGRSKGTVTPPTAAR